MLETPYGSELSVSMGDFKVSQPSSGLSEKDPSQDAGTLCPDDLASMRAYFTKPPVQSLGLCVT